MIPKINVVTQCKNGDKPGSELDIVVIINEEVRRRRRNTVAHLSSHCSPHVTVQLRRSRKNFTNPNSKRCDAHNITPACLLHHSILKAHRNKQLSFQIVAILHSGCVPANIPAMRDDKDRKTGKTDSSDSGLAWNDFDSNRLAFLSLVADKANVIATAHLTDENFHRLIKIAYDGNIISAARLGEFGRRDPTTASRWINRHSTPDLFA